MKIKALDITIFSLGIVFAVLGAIYDMHGFSFFGGSLCGAFAFNMGWKFEEWSAGK
jgi:hypothetical protein